MCVILMHMSHRLTAVFCLFAVAFFLPFPPSARGVLCFGADHLFQLEVYDNTSPIPNATVTFYRNTDRTYKADNKTVAGTEDAEATTGSNGTVTMNLDEATYYVTVIAAGFQTLEIDVGVPADGTCGTHRVFPTSTGLAIVDPAQSTASIDRDTIYADDETIAILTIQARNTHGSVAAGIPVDLTGDLAGMRIEKLATVTDAVGQAKFYIHSTQSGSSFLFPKLGIYSLSPVKLTVLAGSASSTSGNVSRNLSSVILTGNPGISDGITPITATVIIRNSSNVPLGGVNVSMRVSEQDISMDAETAVTDGSGSATFFLRSAKIKTGFVSVLAGGRALDARPAISFLPAFVLGSTVTPTPTPRPAPYQPGEVIPAGTLIKLPDDGNASTQQDTTVYFVSSNGTRHPFTHERIYFTWYKNFSYVQIASPEALANLPLGEPVPFRAGSRLLKFESDPKVYALAATKQIRWIVSEAVATTVYGSAWATLVEEFPASERALFAEGASIERYGDFDPTKEAADAASLNDFLLNN